MISEQDKARIARDAEIASKSLHLIAFIAEYGTLRSSELKEDIKTIRNCVEFIESFCEVEE